MSFLMGGKLFAGIFGFKFLTFYREQEMFFWKIIFERSRNSKGKIYIIKFSEYKSFRDTNHIM